MQGFARELTRRVMVGDVPIGGGAPVVVQSMTCTPTTDADATLAQVRVLAEAGCDLVRVTVPSKEALEPFARVCDESPVPIVADIHFDYRLAIGAVRAGAAKLRINPGNIGDWDRVDAVIDAAGEAGAAIRIGVNAGSLDKAIAERDDLSQPEKLVASSLQFVEHFEKRGFTDIVLSAKAHSVPTTLDTYRALSARFPVFRCIWALPRPALSSRAPLRAPWASVSYFPRASATPCASRSQLTRWRSRRCAGASCRRLGFAVAARSW